MRSVQVGRKDSRGDRMTTLGAPTAVEAMNVNILSANINAYSELAH
jgi:hypothetical protein